MAEVGIDPWAGYTYGAVMGRAPLVGQDSAAINESSFRDYCRRLAVLIDPGVPEDAVRCDIKALLALAEQLDRSLGWCEPDKDGCVRVKADRLREVAQRIRKACGEEE